MYNFILQNQNKKLYLKATYSNKFFIFYFLKSFVFETTCIKI